MEAFSPTKSKKIYLLALLVLLREIFRKMVHWKILRLKLLLINSLSVSFDKIHFDAFTLPTKYFRTKTIFEKQWQRLYHNIFIFVLIN